MSVPTLNTLHKDLKLENKVGFIYDRMWAYGDWVVVNELESANAGILVKMMTVFNEMYGNETYGNFGNKTWFVLKDLETELTRTQIKEYTKIALQEMRRIKEIISLNVVPRPGDSYVVDVNWVVRTITDDDIVGGMTIG